MITRNTQELLENVVRHLNYNVTYNNTFSVDLTMAESEATTIQKTCFKLFSEAEGVHSGISKLFAVVDLLLKQYCNSRIEEQETAPSKLKYSGIQEYLFYEHLLEVSIMMEIVTDSKSYYYYYVSFNFPEQVHAYEVVEIPCDWVPEFVEITRNDAVVINFISSRINEVIDKFCMEFVVKKKFRRREFSIRGITPVFSSPKKVVRKRGKKNGGANYDITKFQAPQNPVYVHLSNLFKKMPEKPTECARLFAVIHQLLLFNFACQSSLENSSWPGGPANDGAVHEIQYSDTLVTQSNDWLYWHTFFLTVMTNGKEFFVCVRFASDTSKKVAKKIVQSLVPTFEEGDLKDYQRITNLSLWLTAIVNHFMKKVIAGSYHSANPSYISSAHDSENE